MLSPMAMNGITARLNDTPCSTTATASATVSTTRTAAIAVKRRSNLIANSWRESEVSDGVNGGGIMPKKTFYGRASCMNWKVEDALNVARYHWIPCIFGLGLLFFMAVEYTLHMVPPSSPPFDLGFVVTRQLHQLLESWPELNTLLAALNTVFVGMQTTYILWTWLMEGRPRATISSVFMFTCRGILGYSTQLPVPQGFLGSGADFPVGNVSFFLFFSGHVSGSVIASIDMRRMQRSELAWTFDALNVLQAIRLLGTRGHYTIDLAVGVGAGILFDFLAGKYEESKRKTENITMKGALT